VGQVGIGIVDPNDPHSLSDALNRIIQVLDSQIEFGDPIDPDNPAATSPPRAGSSGRNGTLQNIVGSWVEVAFTSASSSQAFTHNLDIPVAVAGEPNVRWLFTNFRHSGVGASPGTLSLEFVNGSTLTNNAITLTLRADGTRTINGAGDEVLVSVFLVPAVRWP